MFHQFTFINHGFYGVLWVSVGLEPPFPMICHPFFFLNHMILLLNFSQGSQALRSAFGQAQGRREHRQKRPLQLGEVAGHGETQEEGTAVDLGMAVEAGKTQEKPRFFYRIGPPR